MLAGSVVISPGFISDIGLLCLSFFFVFLEVCVIFKEQYFVLLIFFSVVFLFSVSLISL